MTPPESQPKPDAQQASFAAPLGSAAVETARRRLVGAACMYGAGYALLAKCPELGNYECFRRTMDEAGDTLKATARAYYSAVCEPPNDPSSATRRTGGHECNSEPMAGFAAAHG